MFFYLILLGFLQTHAAIINTIEVPCDKPGYRACQAIIPFLTDAIESHLKKITDHGYKGKIFNPLGSTQAPDLTTVQALTPVCSLNSLFKKPKEETQNYLKKNCGNPCLFDCDQNNNGTEDTCKISDQSNSCTLERSWLRGQFYKNIEDEWHKIETQIKNDKKLVLSETCSTGIKDIQTLLEKYFSEVNRLNEYYKKANINEEINCPENPTGAPGQAGCYLESVKRIFETQVAQIATCEIMYRAETKWESIQNDYNKLVLNSANTAFGQCVGPKGKVIAAYPTYRACLDSKYGSQIKTRFINKTLTQDNTWPTTGINKPKVNVAFPTNFYNSCPQGSGGCLPNKDTINNFGLHFFISSPPDFSYFTLYQFSSVVLSLDQLAVVEQNVTFADQLLRSLTLQESP